MTEPTVATGRPMLRRLADLLGVASAYLDQSGGQERITTDATRERLLAAMGIDASTEERAHDALKRLRRKARHQWLAPVRVVRQRSRSLRRVRVRVPRRDAHSHAAQRPAPLPHDAHRREPLMARLPPQAPQ